MESKARKSVGAVVKEDPRLAVLRALRVMGAIRASVDGIEVSWAAPPTGTNGDTPADETLPKSGQKTADQKRREAREEFERTLFHSS